MNEYKPLLHTAHAEACGVLLYVPAPHDVHATLLSAEEKVPCGHGSHEACALLAKLPAGHGGSHPCWKETYCGAPATHTLPAGQYWQSPPACEV